MEVEIAFQREEMSGRNKGFHLFLCGALALDLIFQVENTQQKKVPKNFELHLFFRPELEIVCKHCDFHIHSIL